jgi:hypothetical protein
MVRATSLSRIVLGTSAALIIATAALAQTSSPTPGSPTTIEAPKKSEGFVARTKAKTQASIKRMRTKWAESRFRRETCRRQAVGQNVAPGDRAEFISDCTRKMAAGKSPATGPNVLPQLFLSPDSQKPVLGGMTATGDGGAMINHGEKKK